MTEKPACPTAEMEQEKVASNVEVKTTEAEGAGKSPEDVSLPKCIGPGCESSAQPDSVYCGNDCILRHAAATMKSFTEVKEPESKAQKPTSASKVIWTTLSCETMCATASRSKCVWSVAKRSCVFMLLSS